MTLVVAYQDPFPILIGDILASASSNQSNLHTPTAGPIVNVFPNGSGYVPTHFAQKIVVIGEHLAAGWSGPVIAARALFRDLMQHHRAGRLEPRNISIAINELQNSTLGRELQLVFFYFSDSSNWAHGGLNCAIDEASSHKVCFLGTGSDAGKSVLLDAIANGGRGVKRISPGADSYVTALGVLRALYQIDVLSPDPLLNYFGGGYEACIYTKTGFNKLGNILHVFWRARFDKGRLLFEPPTRAIYQDYFRDHCVIHSIAITPSSAKEASAIVKRHIIPPIWASPNENLAISAFPNLSISPTFLMNHIVVWKDNRYKLVGEVSANPESDFPVRINRNGKDFIVEVESEYLESLAAYVREDIADSIWREYPPTTK